MPTSLRMRMADACDVSHRARNFLMPHYANSGRPNRQISPRLARQHHPVVQQLYNSSCASGGRFVSPSEQSKRQKDDSGNDTQRHHDAIPSTKIAGIDFAPSAFGHVLPADSMALRHLAARPRWSRPRHDVSCAPLTALEDYGTAGGDSLPM